MQKDKTRYPEEPLHKELASLYIYLLACVAAQLYAKMIRSAIDAFGS